MDDLATLRAALERARVDIDACRQVMEAKLPGTKAYGLRQTIEIIDAALTTTMPALLAAWEERERLRKALESAVYHYGQWDPSDDGPEMKEIRAVLHPTQEPRDAG